MINPDRWRQVQDIYVDAMQMGPLKRTPFLEKVCGADVYMRREVESLLECENKVGKFLEQTAIEVLVRMYGPEVSEEQPDTAGDLIGCVIDDRYIVREYIGSGGMGDVYRADHRLLGMPVAIKRLSRDLRDRKEFRQRFIEEARRTVLLDHSSTGKRCALASASHSSSMSFWISPCSAPPLWPPPIGNASCTWISSPTTSC